MDGKRKILMEIDERPRRVDRARKILKNDEREGRVDRARKILTEIDERQRRVDRRTENKMSSTWREIETKKQYHWTYLTLGFSSNPMVVQLENIDWQKRLVSLFSVERPSCHFVFEIDQPLQWLLTHLRHPQWIKIYHSRRADPASICKTFDFEQPQPTRNLCRRFQGYFYVKEFQCKESRWLMKTVDTIKTILDRTCLFPTVLIPLVIAFFHF